MVGADFEYADIRSADFSRCDLRKANISYAIAGQSIHWIIFISSFLCILLFISGGASGFAGGLAGYFVWIEDKADFIDNTIFFIISGVSSIIFLLLFTLMVIKKGLEHSILGGVTLTVVISIVFAALFGGDDSKVLVSVILQLLILGGAITGAIVCAISAATAMILLGKKAIFLSGSVFFVAAILGALEGVEFLSNDKSKWLALGVAVIIIIDMLSLGIYIAWQATYYENKHYLTIRKTALVFSSIGGTKFCHADLSDADFTSSILRAVDFRNAIIKRTCWFGAKQLNYARLTSTYLEDSAIRFLVVEKNGENRNYDCLSIRGVNLDGAILNNISLIGADLSDSNLQNASLLQAKLVNTQLYNSNLSRACLTGAFIQDWGIATDTNLDNIECKYVYMRLPTTDNPDPWRKPDNREEYFKEGDFADFISPIIKTLNLYHKQNIDPRRMAGTFKTLDLYHYDGIDPSAAAVALKQLAEEYPELGLEVIALEGRGEQKIKLQAIIAGDANQSKLSTEYFEKYSRISSLPYQDVQGLLAGIAEKDERIRSLEEMVKTAIQGEKFYIQTQYNMGDNISKHSSISIQATGDISNISGVVGGDVNGLLNTGSINGDIPNVVGQPSDETTKGDHKLKELLAQLQQLIENEKDLSPEDKTEALQQIKLLREADQRAGDANLKKITQTALKILKGTIASLEDTTKLAAEGTSRIKEISNLLLS